MRKEKQITLRTDRTAAWFAQLVKCWSAERGVAGSTLAIPTLSGFKNCGESATLGVKHANYL